jgi:nucleoredoxin
MVLPRNVVMPLLRKTSIRSAVGDKAPTVPLDALSDKTVMLYFSASWCPPCRAFTPALIKFYKQHKTAKNFEVVFCSWDSSEAEFDTYFGTHPWLAMKRKDVDELANELGVRTIPSLVVLNGATGEIITKEGRMAVVKDPLAEKFPWENMTFEERKGMQLRSATIGLAMSLLAAAALYYYSYYLVKEVEEVPLDE